MNQLFPNPVPPSIDGIDLRCCGVDEVLREVRGARLIVADPPWHYTNQGCDGSSDDIYACLSEAEISAHLSASFDCASEACRLAVWYTWPKDAEWNAAGGAGPRWGARTTGGAWVKTGTFGVGYHWRGQSEPVAVFTKGACGRPAENLINAHVSRPTNHSEKPVDWMRQWVLAWTSPGDLVLDLYAGMAPLARACLGTCRRYVGAEIDPVRHAEALGRLHRFRSMRGGE